MAKAYAVVIGAILLIVGIVGFVEGSNTFMGLQFNMTHNLIHCISGLIGLAAGLMSGGKGARVFAQVFGVIYTLVAILGFAHVGAVETMLMLNPMYNVIHLVVGLLGLLTGFTGGPSKEAAA